MAEEWLTTAQATKLAGYHPDTIRELLRTGQVKGRKWGRDWQVDRASLLAYIRQAGRLGEKRGPKTKS